MRFDLVDLALFVAVAEARSITHGAVRANLALASASGGDLAGYARGLKASVHLLANTAGLAEHLPKALAAFLRDNPHINIDVEERESGNIAQAIAAGAADIGLAIDLALPEGLLRFPFCNDQLMLVVSHHDELARRRQVAFAGVLGRDFVGLASASALQAHLEAQAARLGARLRFRARLKDFEAVCQMVAAGIGLAVVPEAAARRCDRSMKIKTVRLRDPWASRKLSICVRDLAALSRPARQLFEHLRCVADARR
jgi:DNA-binding transcriptional LysR family regulator